MCTVSAIRYIVRGSKADALRVKCNRDESLNRPIAHPPAVRRLGSMRAILPIDPQSGGTWIGTNDAGIVAVLLNVSDGSQSRAGPRSRGEIVPRILRASSLERATQAVLSLNPQDYAPFRLLILTRDDEGCFVSNGGRLHREAGAGGRRTVMRTSSGLGDSLVAGPRSTLFQSIVCTQSPTPAQQDCFHHHAWPDHGELSVVMSRADARTVSITTVTVSEQGVRMQYDDLRQAPSPSRFSLCESSR